MDKDWDITRKQHKPYDHNCINFGSVLICMGVNSNRHGSNLGPMSTMKDSENGDNKPMNIGYDVHHVSILVLCVLNYVPKSFKGKHLNIWQNNLVES